MCARLPPTRERVCVEKRLAVCCCVPLWLNTNKHQTDSITLQLEPSHHKTSLIERLVHSALDFTN